MLPDANKCYRNNLLKCCMVCFAREHFSCWAKISADDSLKYFSSKIGFDISIDMIFYFLGKIRKVSLVCHLLNCP